MRHTLFNEIKIKGTALCIASVQRDTLRDTGCSGIIVKQKFVKDGQYTGQYGLFQMVDNSYTMRKVPIARMEIDTPYLSGTVEALCPPDAIYNFIVGNVLRATAADDPDPQLQLAGVTTRAMAKKKVK